MKKLSNQKWKIWLCVEPRQCYIRIKGPSPKRFDVTLAGSPVGRKSSPCYRAQQRNQGKETLGGEKSVVCAHTDDTHYVNSTERERSLLLTSQILPPGSILALVRQACLRLLFASLDANRILPVSVGMLLSWLSCPVAWMGLYWLL